MAKKESLNGKSDQELLDMLGENRKQLREERFAAAGARAKEPNQAQKLRKSIARTLTEMHARSRTSLVSSSSDEQSATATN